MFVKTCHNIFRILEVCHVCIMLHACYEYIELHQELCIHWPVPTFLKHIFAQKQGSFAVNTILPCAAWMTKSTEWKAEAEVNRPFNVRSLQMISAYCANLRVKTAAIKKNTEVRGNSGLSSCSISEVLANTVFALSVCVSMNLPTSKPTTFHLNPTTIKFWFFPFPITTYYNTSRETK